MIRNLLKKIVSTLIIIILSPISIAFDITIIVTVPIITFFGWLYDSDVENETYISLLLEGYAWFFTNYDDTVELFQVLCRNLYK
jgi:hypothetical protein